MPLHLPIQAVVDRRVPLSLAPMIDQEVRSRERGDPDPAEPRGRSLRIRSQ